MKVAELIERLNECDPDAEIRLAYQPSYPLQAHLKGVAVLESDDDEGFAVSHDMVYLVAGSDDYDHPYAPRDVFDNAW